MYCVLSLAIAGALFVREIRAQDANSSQVGNFSLYPTVDPTSLAQALNISEDCLDALNTTLPCDPTLFQMAGTVDSFYWELDNITTLCTNDCFGSVDFWDEDVQIRCALDNIVAYGKSVPAASISGRFNDGFHIACLTNQNASERGDVGMSYCLLESQDWVGSDVIRPNCSSDSTDPSCSDPADVSPENERLANLYTDDVLCDECFVQMMYQRLQSPYLPDHDYSDYLISQYQDILDVCNATDNMPELIIRQPPDYSSTIPPPIQFNTTTNTTNAVCSGQTIVKTTLDPNANCNTIAQAFKVATGDVLAVTSGDNCTVTTPSICLPASCTLHQIAANDTCDSLAAAFSTSSLNVSAISFLAWNPNINGLCDSLPAGDYVCASAPGGSYVPPSSPSGSTNANTQQRGGNDGSTSGTPDNSTLPLNSTTTSPSSGTGSGPVSAPSPTQNGITSGCTNYAKAAAGDYCTKFAQENKITPDELYAWNTVLGQGGSNCNNMFFANYYYCIAAAAPSSSQAVPSQTASSPSQPVPSPTQTGIASNCNKYQKAASGDYCSKFAGENNISSDNLYAWNPVLGKGGSNCATMFFAAYYYCVGVGG